LQQDVRPLVNVIDAKIVRARRQVYAGADSRRPCTPPLSTIETSSTHSPRLAAGHGRQSILTGTLNEEYAPPSRAEYLVSLWPRALDAVRAAVGIDRDDGGRARSVGVRPVPRIEAGGHASRARADDFTRR
jgi:hypothetical protein